MDVRPADIARRRFSRALFGANHAEVSKCLAEAAATLERVHADLARVTVERVRLQTSVERVNAELARVTSERAALQTSLERRNAELARATSDHVAAQASRAQTSAEVERLRHQLDEAQAKAAAYQAQESLMAQALISAQKAAEDLTRASAARAEQTIADATAAARETIERARGSAADLLRATKASAQEAIEAADRAAAARIAEARLETERLREEANREAGRTRHAAQEQVARFIARLEAFVTSQDELSKHLEALERGYAESLRLIGRIHEEVSSAVLPSLRSLVPTLEEMAAPPPRPEAPSPVPAASPAPTVAPAPEAGTAAGPRAPVPPALPDGNQVPGSVSAPAGEIVISPVRSYLQATRLVTAVSRIKAVRSARLRSYSKGNIIIDVVTEGGAFAAIDPHMINGFPLDVVEATDRRMVLRIVPDTGPASSH